MFSFSSCGIRIVRSDQVAVELSQVCGDLFDLDTFQCRELVIVVQHCRGRIAGSICSCSLHHHFLVSHDLTDIVLRVII